MSCIDCGLSLTARIGRGPKPIRCDECKLARRDRMTHRRLARAAVRDLGLWIERLWPAATPGEWVEFVGYIETVRTEVALRQQGKCVRCDHEGRLLLAVEPFDGKWIGLCVADHREWRT